MKPLKELDAPEIAAELTVVHPHLTPAVELATYLHDGQSRGPRNGQPSPPYIEHPLRVAARLARAGATDRVLLTSAVLHDTIEDCEERIAQLAGRDPGRGTSLQYLEQKFGAETAHLVKLLSNPESGSYLEHVTQSVSQDARVLIDKTSDWLDNAGSLHHTPLLAPRLSRKYQPMTSVLLEQLDRQYEEVQDLLDGNFYAMRNSILRAGFRLELLSRPR